MQKLNETKNVFFDMDGVLCEYTPEDYTTDFLSVARTSTHYFKNRHPQTQVVAAMRLLIANHYKNVGDMNVSALSTLVTTPNGEIIPEHIVDKQIWLAQHGIQTPLFTAIQGHLSKAELAEQILDRPLTKHDYLIDDYRRNLNDWSEHGGCAILCRNNINKDKAFAGLSIDIAEKTDYAFYKELEYLISKH